MADNKFQTPEALARCLPMSRLQAVLSGKWKILILWYVAFYRVQRFGALLRRLDGITQSTLTRQLRELEAFSTGRSIPRFRPGWSTPSRPWARAFCLC